MQRKIGEKYIVEVLATGLGCDNSTLLSDKQVLSEKRFDELNLQKLDEDKDRKLAEYIIRNFHHCPIPVELICEFGFRREGCVDCLLAHVDLLKLPREG